MAVTITRESMAFEAPQKSSGHQLQALTRESTGRVSAAADGIGSTTESMGLELSRVTQQRELLLQGGGAAADGSHSYREECGTWRGLSRSLMMKQRTLSATRTTPVVPAVARNASAGGEGREGSMGEQLVVALKLPATWLLQQEHRAEARIASAGGEGRGGEGRGGKGVWDSSCWWLFNCQLRGLFRDSPFRSAPLERGKGMHKLMTNGKG
ncbi:unnamed protein product, partial [Closterium sp. NIES-53]